MGTPFIFPFFSFFFFHRGHVEVPRSPGQGSNLYHSSNLGCWSDNTRSLTCCTKGEFPKYSPFDFLLSKLFTNEKKKQKNKTKKKLFLVCGPKYSKPCFCHPPDGGHRACFAFSTMTELVQPSQQILQVSL